MNPFFTAMRLAEVMLQQHARDRSFLDHFRKNDRRQILECLRDHEDALAKRAVEDMEQPVKRLCQNCEGSGEFVPGSNCRVCDGTGWEEI